MISFATIMLESFLRQEFSLPWLTLELKELESLMVASRNGLQKEGKQYHALKIILALKLKETTITILNKNGE